mmetsp:Transcript_57884/g.161553  ORF Transcript_57884/g.161553 Transcript_57884/m.161553 type:complete len:193 (-) Transcript_57884:183-761(-)
MAAMASQQGFVAERGAQAADDGVQVASFWPARASKLCGGTGDSKASPFYYYPGGTFSKAISMQTREWLHACWHSAEKVQEMLAAGIDIHTANSNGFTGLHMAASKFKLGVAKALVEAGHDVNVEDCNGLTPLDYCFDNGLHGEQGVYSEKNGNKPYIAMVEFLESKGAFRREELSWLTAANQEKHTPGAGAR